MIDVRKNPSAYAVIRGNKNHPDIKGKVDFYDTYGGTIIVASVKGLPEENGEGSRDFTVSIFTKAVHVRRMIRESFLMQAGIIIRRIPYIRLMQGIFRRY